MAGAAPHRSAGIPTAPLCRTPAAIQALRCGAAARVRGAALTIALVILAALLLLGVPFLYLQMSGIGGNRAFAQAAEARRGLATAEALAVALAMYHAGEPGGADNLYAVGGGRQWSSLAGSLGSATNPGTLDPLGLGLAELPGSASAPSIFAPGDEQGSATAARMWPAGDGSTFAIAIDAAASDRSRLALLLEARRTYERAFDDDLSTGDTARLGATIEDESGKLDPNFMSVAQWDALLKSALGRRPVVIDPDSSSGALRVRDPLPTEAVAGYVDADWDDDGFWLYQDATGPATTAFVLILDGEDSQDHRIMATGDTTAHPGYPSSVASDQPHPNQGSNPGVNDDDDDPDRYGELARALAELRGVLGRRIATLDELLLADPRYNRDARLTYVYGDGIQPLPLDSPGNRYGFRTPLTRDELDRLRPYLSLHNPGQGRDGGIADAGTIVAIDDANARAFIDAEPREILAVGTWLRFGDGRGPTTSAQFTGGTSQDSIMSAASVPLTYGGQAPFALGDPMAIEIPPTININAAAPAVLATIPAAWPRLPQQTIYPPPAAPLPTPEMGLPDLPSQADLSQLHAAAFSEIRQAWAAAARPWTVLPDDGTGSPPFSPWQLDEAYQGFDLWQAMDPRLGVLDDYKTIATRGGLWKQPRIETPALALRGYGAFAIRATATVTGAATGEPTATATSDRIVQVVPQESVLERRWTTQADFQALIAQRHASRSASGPRALARVLPGAPGEPDALGAFGGPDPTDGWIQAAPLASVATGHRTRYEQTPSINAPWFPTTWALPLGAGRPQTLAEMWRAGLRLADAGAGDPTPNDYAALFAHLGPDGLTAHANGRSVAIALDASTARMLPVESPDYAVKPVALDLWFHPGDDDWSSGLPRTIVDLDPGFETVRCLTNDDVPGVASLGDATSQVSTLRLTYDPGWKCLVLTATPVAAQAATGSLTIAGFTRSWDPHARACLYHLGPDGMRDRWHRITITMGDRAGGMLGMLVDGHAGRDLGSDAYFGEQFWFFGDHITLPQFRLSGGSAPDPTTMRLVLPLGLPDATALLPTDGDLRIGNDVVSYSLLSPDGTLFPTSDPARRRRPDDPRPSHHAYERVYPGGVGMPPAAGGAGAVAALWSGGGWDSGPRRYTLAAKYALPQMTTAAGAESAGTLAISGLAAWPEAGVLKAGDQVRIFVRQGGVLSVAPIAWDRIVSAGASWGPATPAGILKDTPIELIGIAIDGPGWQDGHFDPAGGMVQVAPAVQIPAAPQRAWVPYRHIVLDPGIPGRVYLIAGTDSTVAKIEQPPGGAGYPWQSTLVAGDRVVPVQSASGMAAITRLLPGDLVTWTAGALAQQAKIDHCHAPVGGGGEFRFSLTGPLRWPMANPGYVVGMGWLPASGDALAMPVIPPLPTRPLMRLGEPRLSLLSERGIRTDTVRVDAIATAQRTDAQATVADVYRILPDATGSVVWQSQLLSGFGIPIGAVGQEPILIQASAPIFTGGMGLVRINGAVHAYRRLATSPRIFDAATPTVDPPPPASSISESDARWGVLLPTPLLGCQQAAGAAIAFPGLPIERLPLGPVAVVTQRSDGIADGWFQLSHGDGVMGDPQNGQPYAATLSDFDAPAALVVGTSATTAAISVVSLVGPRMVSISAGGTTAAVFQEFQAPTWLRGQYGSDLPAPRADGLPGLRPGDIVIGWWPRYPSPLPEISGDREEPVYRSRLRSWFGFPFRLHGAVFDPRRLIDANGTAVEPAVVDVFDDGGLDVAVRALAVGADWPSRPPSFLGNGRNDDLASIFGPSTGGPGWAQFQAGDQPIATDGAELRIDWAIPQSIQVMPIYQRIAEAGGRTPRISTVRLRCRAPTAVLATDGR